MKTETEQARARLHFIAADAVKIVASETVDFDPVVSAGINKRSFQIACSVIRKIREQYHIRRKVK